MDAVEVQQKVSKRITINISGEIFETFAKTLHRFPDTLLGNPVKIERFYCKNDNLYFFNRHRHSFEAILYFYQSNGILSRPSNINMEYFLSECLYFELPPSSIDSMMTKEGLLIDVLNEEPVYNDNSCQVKVWKFLELPDSSIAASIYAIVSLLVILISVILACVETIPSLGIKDEHVLYNPWFMADIVLNAWFLFELVVRFSFSLKKCKFFRKFLNIIDVLAVLPYFITLFLSQRKVQSLGFLKLLRLMRVIRLFRLSKNSLRLRLVGQMIKSCGPDFQILIFSLILVIIFGGNLMYYVEGTSKETKFTSIPECLWWALQTVTTVGYGDITPVTNLGKLLAACIMIFGAVTVSLPVLSFITKFSSMYSRNIATPT